MINAQMFKKNNGLLLSLGSIALSQLLHVAFVGLSVLILQVKEHLGVILMGLQSSSDAFPQIVVEGSVLIES